MGAAGPGGGQDEVDGGALSGEILGLAETPMQLRQPVAIDMAPESLAPAGEGARPGEDEGCEVLDHHHVLGGERVRQSRLLGGRDEARQNPDRGQHVFGRLHAPTLAQVKRNGNML